MHNACRTTLEFIRTIHLGEPGWLYVMLYGLCKDENSPLRRPAHCCWGPAAQRSQNGRAYHHITEYYQLLFPGAVIPIRLPSDPLGIHIQIWQEIKIVALEMPCSRPSVSPG